MSSFAMYTIRLDQLQAPTDILTLNVSVSAHGLCPKLSGNVGDVLRGDGTWGAPPSSGAPFAKVTFNGQGVVAIIASDNVSSVTDLGTGNYQIVFTSAFANANYHFCSGQSMNSGVTVGISPQIDSAVPPTTTTCNIQTYSLAGAGHDFNRVSCVFFAA